MSRMIPTIVQISRESGVYINLNNVVSYSVNRQLPQKTLREGVKPSEATEKDYVVSAHADTISVYFIAGTGLAFRVGHEITQEEFNNLAILLKELCYERRTGNDTVAKPTA